MSIDTIGREILPNLYIKNIELSTTTVKITVAFFDYLDQEGNITWLTPDFVNFSRVRMNLILANENSDLENIFNQGDYNLYEEKQKLPATTFFTNRDKVIQFKELSSIKQKIINKLNSVSEEGFIEVNHTFEFTINDYKEFQELVCYSFFSYDPYEEEGSLYLDTSGEGKRMLNGPIMSEYIMRFGQIVTSSRRYSIDTIGYSGPVHMHEGQFMEGSFHTEVPHRFVDFDVVQNTKISITNLLSEYVAKPNLPVNEQRVFSDPYIAVGNKQVYGYFQLNTESYFRKKRRFFKSFINSSISLNMFKIKEYIQMKINNEPVDITEVLINHSNSNDMWFYFEAPFNSYTETDLEIEFIIDDINSFFKDTFEKLKIQFDNFLAPFQKVALVNKEYVPIAIPREMLEFINGYVGLVSMDYDVDLVELKKKCVSSLYKNIVKTTVLQSYIEEYQERLYGLSHKISLAKNTPSSEYIETYETTVKLQNYRYGLSFLGGRKLIDPDKIAEHLELTNGKLTEMSGLFQNLEQVLIPRYVRNNLQNLQEIDYNSLEGNDSLLKVLQPEETEEEEEIDIAFDGTLEPDSNQASPEFVDVDTPDDIPIKIE